MHVIQLNCFGRKQYCCRICMTLHAASLKKKTLFRKKLLFYMKCDLIYSSCQIICQLFFFSKANCTSDFSVSNRLLADSTVHPQLQTAIHQPYYAWQTAATGSSSQQDHAAAMFHQNTASCHMQPYSTQTPAAAMYHHHHHHHHSLLPSFEQQFNGNTLSSNLGSMAEEHDITKTGLAQSLPIILKNIIPLVF